MAPDIDVQLVPLFSERCHCIVPVELVNVIVLLSPKHTDVGDAEAVPPNEAETVIVPVALTLPQPPVIGML